MTDIKYHSQVGQDKFVINALKFKTNGFFFEFGSQDPIKINNSYTLEKDFGWTGVMFEWDEKYATSEERKIASIANKNSGISLLTNQ